MCGIAGIASTVAIADRGWLPAAEATMQHRGPDASGEWWSNDARVGLAHRRLAIIDLSPAAHQPMRATGADNWIVFNGEIYNFRDLRAELAAAGHQFRTSSDTEVILNAYAQWGIECLTRLEGMFAFALYDARDNSIFLARDRAGEKPLFVMHRGNELRFASELKALMIDRSIRWSINREALDCYLAMGYVPGEICILDSVQKLQPAHGARFDLKTGRLEIWRYWVPATFDTSAPPIDEGDLVAELDRLLEASVRRQLVADVPVGVLLSGGVDSGLVTAMAARCSSAVKTFTVSFPGHDAYDETEHARLIARHFGTEHLELRAEASAVSLLPRLARQYDEPIIDSSMIPTYLLSSVVRQHCTVVLGGDGGDELFGGYIHHNRLLALAQRVAPWPQWLRAPIANGVAAMLPAGAKGRNWLQAAGTAFDSTVPLIASYFDKAARRRLLRGEHGLPLVAESIRAARMPRKGGLLERITRMDFENYLPEDILVKVDRASMLNSLEVRAPLLDSKIIDFAFQRVPARLKATRSSRKILPKLLAARILPPKFDLQRKQGFSIPLATWLQSDTWSGYFRDVLLTGDSLFEPTAVKALLNGQRRGRANSERLFGLVMFELWRREYGLSLGN